LTETNNHSDGSLNTPLYSPLIASEIIISSPLFGEPRRVRALHASAVLPGHVLSPWFGEPRRVRAFCARLPCSLGTSSALGQLLLSLYCALFSAICALRAVCFVTCVVPSGGCQPGSARLLSYGSFASAAQRSHCMFMQWDRMDS
jgi:hypothetical protein